MVKRRSQQVHLQAVLDLRALIASDGYAATFQTLAAYRRSLAETIDQHLTNLTPHHDHPHRDPAQPPLQP